MVGNALVPCCSRSALLRRIDTNLLTDAVILTVVCSLLCYFFGGVMVFYSCLLKNRKRHHVEVHLFWNTDSASMVSALSLSMKRVMASNSQPTNSQQWMQLARTDVDPYREQMSQAPWSSAWIIGTTLFPGGLGSAILKTKYPSKTTYLLPIHLISTESSLPQDEEGISFYLLTADSSRLGQGFYQWSQWGMSVSSAAIFSVFSKFVFS